MMPRENVSNGIIVIVVVVAAVIIIIIIPKDVQNPTEGGMKLKAKVT